MKYNGTMTIDCITEADYDYQYKIVMVGDQTTGKTNILTRYLNGSFENTVPTWAVEFAYKDYETENGEKIRLQLWDTSGSDKYRSISFGHMRRAVGAFLVYDLTNQETFYNLNFYLDGLRDNADEHVTVMLIPNKCDVMFNNPEKREVK